MHRREQSVRARLWFHSCTGPGDEIRPRQEAVFLNSKLLFLPISFLQSKTHLESMDSVLLPVTTAPMSGVGLGCWLPSPSVSLCYLNTPDYPSSALVINTPWSSQLTPGHPNSPLTTSTPPGHQGCLHRSDRSGLDPSGCICPG